MHIIASPDSLSTTDAFSTLEKIHAQKLSQQK